MSDKLKIYACSGVGSTTQDAKQLHSYWLDGTRTVSNTQGVNTLLALINLELAELNTLPLNDHERLEKYNKLDLLTICLRVAQRYGDDEKKLALAGKAIGKLAQDGTLDCVDTDDDSRSAHLDAVYSRVLDMVASGQVGTTDPEFVEWYNTTILQANKVGLTKEQQKAVQGVGATDEQDPAYYISNSKDYFLYLYIPNDDIKNWKPIVAERRDKQREIYAYCVNCLQPLYGAATQQVLQAQIRKSILETFGTTPEKVLEGMKGNKGVAGEPVTLSAMAIAAIIVTCIQVVGSIIAAVIACCAQVAAAKYSQPINSAAGIPDANDFDDAGWDGKSGKKDNKMMIILAAIALLLFSKK